MKKNLCLLLLSMFIGLGGVFAGVQVGNGTATDKSLPIEPNYNYSIPR